jgi:1-acyl-sn-glycerol-3-phosphate acyltransferase
VEQAAYSTALEKYNQKKVEMGVENIERYSRLLAFFKGLVRLWHHKVFYRKVVYVHRESLPLNQHLIFTPNHQNALMDALAVHGSLPNQFVFVARSDIFKNKYIARFLYFLKILPVYRIRDGYDSLKKNATIFEKTLDIIRNKNGFVILPEGNHAGFRRLRSLKKGFARIAFQAEEQENFTLDMKIVPVGIHYSDYQRFRSDLLVIFGKPFPVSDFYTAYLENPAVAYNRIREKLAREMKPLMIHISSPHYQTYDFLRKAYREKACWQMQLDPEDLYHRFKAEKEIIARLERFEAAHPEEMEKLSQKTDEYDKLLKKMKIRDVQPVPLAHLLGQSWLWLFTLPLFVYGYLNHLFPWNITQLVARRIKDPQFRSSFKFVVSLLAFPFFYLLQTGVVYLLFRQFWITVAYAVSLPVSAAIAWHHARLFRSIVSGWRFVKRNHQQDRLLQKAETLYRDCTTTMDSLFENTTGKTLLR